MSKRLTKRMRKGLGMDNDAYIVNTYKLGNDIINIGARRYLQIR